MYAPQRVFCCRRQAFTLMELLVVISIIAILAGLLLPVGASVLNNSRKAKASTDMRTVINAVSSYAAEYGHLPLTPDQITGASYGYDTVYGDPGDYSRDPGFQLYDILRGVAEKDNLPNAGNQLNPRQVKYLDIPDAKNPADPRSGILAQDFNDGNYTIKKGALVDPWGSEYVIWLDANGDGDMNTAIKWFYPNYPDTQGPRGTVLAASLGPDGNFGKNGALANSDDIVTW